MPGAVLNATAKDLILSLRQSNEYLSHNLNVTMERLDWRRLGKLPKAIELVPGRRRRQPTFSLLCIFSFLPLLKIVRYMHGMGTYVLTVREN